MPSSYVADIEATLHVERYVLDPALFALSRYAQVSRAPHPGTARFRRHVHTGPAPAAGAALAEHAAMPAARQVSVIVHQLVTVLQCGPLWDTRGDATRADVVYAHARLVGTLEAAGLSPEHRVLVANPPTLGALALLELPPALAAVAEKTLTTGLGGVRHVFPDGMVALLYNPPAGTPDAPPASLGLTFTDLMTVERDADNRQCRVVSDYRISVNPDLATVFRLAPNLEVPSLTAT